MFQVTAILQQLSQANQYDKLSTQDNELTSKIHNQMDKVCRKSKRWFNAEYFYSYIDKPYFIQNDLVDPLDALDMPVEFNKAEWTLIKEVIHQLSAALADG